MSIRSRVPIQSFLLASIFILLLWPGAGAVAYELSSAEQLQRFTAVAETEQLALYIDEATTEIAILDKRVDHVWYSNPVDRDRDPIAKGAAKEGLNTQIEISYFMPTDEQRFMNNYANSVVSGQYEISMIENGVRVDYVFGTAWKDKDYLPVMISKDRMEEAILKNVENEADRRFLVSKYDLISLRKIDDPDFRRVAVSRVDLDRVFGDYTLVTTKPLDPTNKAKLIGHLADTIVDGREDVTDRRYLGPEHFSHLIDSEVYLLKRSVFAWDLEDMIEIVKKSGYTPEDRQIDDMANNLWPRVPSFEVFEVSVEYTLSGDSLVVRVPVDDIVYPVKQPTTYKSRGGQIVVDEEGRPVFDESGPTSTMPLHSITLLSNFGAAGQEKDGYILVPDGSGALIHLNNGKTYVPPFASPVYGADNSVSVGDPLLKQVHLPVFGMKQDDAAFFAVIEEGEALATLRADVSGRSNMYNRVYSEFVIIPTAVTVMQMTETERGINIYQVRPSKTDIAVRYVFLYGQDSTYSGMARYYQSYLESKYGIKRLDGGDIPFFIELIGAIDVRKPVLGVNRQVSEPLTTFDEAVEIVDTLVAKGVRNLGIIYAGWANGGLNHFFPSRLEVDSAVGSEDEFAGFVDYAENIGAKLYPTISLLNVHRTSLFDGFSPRSDAARSLTRQIAMIYRQNLAAYLREETQRDYLLSPSRLVPLAERLIPQLKDKGLTGICVPYIGQQVNSDFRERERDLVDRQQALDMQIQSLSLLKEGGFDVLVRGGNEYVLPFASGIVGIPEVSSNYRIVDRSIPFYQMVLHGYVDYAGEPLNISDNYQEALLRSIEYGSAPYYRWMYREAEVIKGTDHDYLYSANYRHWVESATEFYNSVIEVLGSLHDQRIVDHRMVMEDVYATTYESGDTVIVNYRNVDVKVSGVTVGHRSYAVVREGAGHEER